jgi:predicted permease
LQSGFHDFQVQILSTRSTLIQERSEILGSGVRPMILQDLRFAIRTLRRRPTFTSVAVVTLGLGIGATTAIFSVVDAVLLRPLPFREPASLMSISRTFPEWRDNEILRKDWDRIAMSYPKFREWQSAQHSFAEAGAWASWFATITGTDRPEQVSGLRVSPSLLPMLGVQPVIGRLFLPDDGLPDAPRTALISFELWATRFGGDGSVVGRTVGFDGTPYTVIGVVPALTNLTGQGQPPAVWIAAGALPQDQNANNNQFRVVARLAPNVSIEQASLETERLVRGDESPAKLGARVAPWQIEITRTARKPLLMLLGAAGLLLLIGCGNVAMLLLGESNAREQEMATRLSLGAGRMRLVRQLLTESVILAIAGAFLGALLAFVGTKALVTLAPPQIPRLYAVATDLRVLGFSLLCAIATGIGFGVIPALALATSSPASLLGTASRTMSRRRGRLQRSLVAIELALCVPLLVSAGLLARSLSLLTVVDPGFRPEDLAVVKFGTPRTWYSDEVRAREFYRAVVERVAAIPGVERVSMTSGAPFDRSTASTNVEIPSAGTTATLPSEYRVVMPDYFETVGIPLLAGRAIDATDQATSPRSVVINAALARRAWPNESAIGKRVRTGDEDHTVVGVVGDIKNAGLDADAQMMFYLSANQEQPAGSRLVVRTRLGSQALSAQIRRVVTAVNPAIPVTAVDFMPTLVSQSIAEPRYRAALIALFAVIAGVLAAVGVYGVTARTVSQQSREIGIRLALGSSGSGVVRLFLGRTMSSVVAGLAVGVAGAFAASRLLAPYLFKVTPTDPLTFVGVVGLLVAVGIGASWLPARFAARMNPAVVLRR